MRQHSALATALVIVTGVAASAGAAAWLRARETGTIAARFEPRADDAVRLLQARADFELEVLHGLGALPDPSGAASAERFAAFASPALERHGALRGLAWIAPGAGPQPYPLALTAPPDARDTLFGFDLASDPQVAEALRAASERGTMQMTPPLARFGDSDDGPTFFVVHPVYRGADGSAERPETLAGLALGAYRVQGLLASLACPGSDVILTVVDDGGPGEGRVIHRGAGEVAAEPIEERGSIWVAGRLWTVIARPARGFVTLRRTEQPQLTLGLGLLATAAFVAYGRVSARRQGRIEQLVERRTHDLSEANERLEEQRKILQSVLDNLGDGVAVADERGRLVLFNPAAVRILGLGLTDAGPERWSEVYGLYRPDARTPVPAEELPLARAIAGVESRDVEMFVRNPKRLGGVFIRVTATPLKDRQGALRGGVAVFRDISERKWTEAVLSDSEARFRAIVEATASALIILSSDHRILEFNARAERVFGLSRATALGHDFLTLCLPGEYREAVATDLQKARLGQPTPGFEIPIQSRDGVERTLLWSFSRMTDAAGGAAVVIATGHDITERRQAERTRRMRELAAHLQGARETERQRVAREIHDELGQALTGLKLEVSYLSRRAGKDDALIPERLAQVSHMIDQTIAAVRRIAADLRPQLLDELGLVEAIRWLAVEFERRTEIPCALELPPDEIVTGADQATAMFRIVQEALTNVARHASATRAAIRVMRLDGQLVVEISDDGRGITTDEATATRSFGVLGMEERARMFGGTVRVEARAPRGTTVTASIPC